MEWNGMKCEIKWNQLKSNETKWNQMKSNEINWNQMKPNEIKWDQMKSNEIKWNQFNSNQIKSNNDMMMMMMMMNHHNSEPWFVYPIIGVPLSGKFMWLMYMYTVYVCIHQANPHGSVYIYIDTPIQNDLYHVWF